MGMFENLAKQLENFDDDDDDKEIDDESMKEAEKVMQQMFGSMMGGSGAGGQGAQEPDAMLQELFKSMGMQMPAPPK